MKKKKQNTGFTIVELLLVVAIIMVLLGVSFLALGHQQRNMKQLELDTVAREIFVAAQNHMTVASRQGLMEAMAESGGGADAKFGTKVGEKGEYCLVVGSEWNSENDNGMLGLMLPFGSLDETLRIGGSYVIQYDRASAQVLNVFYAQPKAQRFAYTFSSGDFGSLPNYQPVRLFSG